MGPSTLAGSLRDIKTQFKQPLLLDTVNCTYVFGNIAFTGCIDVESSPVIYREVTRALVLTNELHLLYLVTPLDNRDSVEPQWMTYFRQVRIRQKCAKKSAGM